jgi:hypothetical protein
MKKTVLILVAISIFFTVGGHSSIFSQDAPMAHVAVVQFSNQTGSASYDAACKAATDTLFLTLRQLGRYRVQSEDTAGSGEDALRAMAEEKRLDFIMYGKMSKGKSGGIDCSLSVFDRAKGKTSLSRSGKAAGVLDVFEVADELVVSVLESMTGSHIGFGSLKLTNTGEKGSYAVLMDGYPVGKDLASIERVLNGIHAVTVVQKRMLGDRQITSSSVKVNEGEIAALEFSVPYLMDDEKQKVESLKAAIKAGWNDTSRSGEVDARMGELTSLFGDLSYSPRLSSYKDEARQLGGEWMLRKSRLEIEDSAWEPRLELMDGTAALYAGAAGYPDPGKIRGAFEENSQLVETFFELAAGKALGDKDIATAQDCFGKALMLTTKYLGGARLTDYAYAVTILKDFQEKAKAQGAAAWNDADLKSVFGPWITAGQRFYGLRDQVTAGKVCAILASDVATMVSVNKAEFAPAPLALPRASESRVLSVQPKGTGKPVAVAAAVGERLLFAPDGFASFGKIAGPQPTTAAKAVLVRPPRGWDRPLGSQYFLIDPLGFLLMGPSIEYGFRIMPSVTFGVNVMDYGLGLLFQSFASGQGASQLSSAWSLGLTSNQFFASRGPNHWYLEELVQYGTFSTTGSSSAANVLFGLAGVGYRWRFPSGFFIDAAGLFGIGTPLNNTGGPQSISFGILPLKLGWEISPK